MKMDRFYKQIVRYAVRIGIADEKDTLCGTGTLFPIPSRKEMYILTVAHVAELLKKRMELEGKSISLCCKDDAENIIKIIVNDFNNILIHSRYQCGDVQEEKQEYFFDVAVIRVPWEEWMEQYSPYMLKCSEIRNDLSGYGFPESLEWERKKVEANLFSGIGRLVCDAEYVDKERFAVNYKLFAERDISRDSIAIGFSGTGLYSFGMQNIYYRGVFSCSRGDRTAGYKAWAMDSCIIADLFRENNIDVECLTLSKEDQEVEENDCSTFAYMIDQIKDKEESRNAFHYLNPEIGFWGRENEMMALENFINDNRDLLFMGIAAPGGCGKSKLVHEFFQQHKNDLDWKLQYIGKSQIQRLMSFPTYAYSKNLLLIIDYAGLYAKKLGEWLYHISSLQATDRPRKLRLLVLERSQGCKLLDADIPPRWLSGILGSGERKTVLLNQWYKNEAFLKGWQLKPLVDEAIMLLMKQYAKQKNKEVSEETIQKLLKYLKLKENNRMFAARPLISLFIIDAYIRGCTVFSWNVDEIMEHFIERFYIQWEQLSEGNEALKDGISNCVCFATATGELDLEEYPEYLQSSIEKMQELGDDEYVNLISAINQSTDYRNSIFPLEPDIVGEYFLFKKMQTMVSRKSKMQKMMNAIWDKTPNSFEVFARSIYDYGLNKTFRDFYLQHLDELMPLDRNDLEIEAHSRLLHMMVINFNGNSHKLVVIDKLKELYRRYPEHPVLKGDYAAALMLEAGYRYFLKPREQEQCTEEVARLYRENRESYYIQLIYGKCLGNQIQGYLEIRKQYNDSKRRIIDERIKYYSDWLCELSKRHPNNKEIKRTIERVKLYSWCAK